MKWLYPDRSWRGIAAGMVLLGTLWLGGCASTVTSEVTAFKQAGWQNDAPRTYAFDTEKAQQDQLDRLTYQQWLAETLAPLGFSQVSRAQARYLVGMSYEAAPGLVRVVDTAYPDPWYGPWGPYWGPYAAYRPWGPWGPGYWPPATVVRDVPVTVATLSVVFKEAAGGRPVYQVTARQQTEGGSLQSAMPYLIRSAFANFPADDGRPRRVTLPLDKADR